MSLTPSELTPAAVCAIVVTYNPDPQSLDCIRKAVATAAHTIVIDNHSNEACVQELRRLAGGTVTLIESPANTGVAAGHNLGIRTAADKGYGWFLLLDQDTELFPSAVQNLIKVYADCFAKFGPKLGLLGSNYYPLKESGEIAKAMVPLCYGNSWSEESLLITSGTLISLENFGQIGPFREDFFIDHVDHDYCLRALRKGFVIASTALPVMIHRLGQVYTKRPWLALGKKKTMSFYSPLRRYYQLRNFLVLAREYEQEFPESIAFIRKSVLKETGRALKYQGNFYRNLMAVLLARRHSRDGINGKYNGSTSL